MKTLKTVAVMAASSVVLSACTIIDTAPDEQAIRYNHGVGMPATFDACFPPSQHDLSSITDVKYYYPAGQRVYNFVPDGGDGDVFEVVTKDGITLRVEGAVRFTLTDDCENFRQFHEKVGLKTNAYEEEGWREFLRIYLRAPINRALTDATQSLGWRDLYSDPKVKADWEHKVSELLPKYVEQTIGGAYLENYGVTLQKPSLPEDLEKSLRASEVAIEQERAQRAKNEAVRTELDSIRELVDVLGVDGYNTHKAIEDGKVQVVPIPQGSSVVVQK